MTTTDIDPAASSASVVSVVPGARAPGAPGRIGDPRLDEFARRAGPDVALGSGPGTTWVYAIFAIDPETNKIRVQVVDDAGHLIRMIPPKSVAEMVAAMNRYGR